MPTDSTLEQLYGCFDQDAKGITIEEARILINLQHEHILELEQELINRCGVPNGCSCTK